MLNQHTAISIMLAVQPTTKAKPFTLLTVEKELQQITTIGIAKTSIKKMNSRRSPISTEKRTVLKNPLDSGNSIRDIR
ncbi:MAG: hypothetical protein QXY26_09325 [Ignisphaera sp.]